MLNEPVAVDELPDPSDLPTAANVSRWLTSAFDRLLPCGWFVAEADGADAVDVSEQFADGSECNGWTLPLGAAQVLLARIGSWQGCGMRDMASAIGEAQWAAKREAA